MKKSLKIFSIIALAGWVTLSCSKLNELPKFDDKDAFVAFNSASMSFNENAGVVNIPVSLVSLNGLTTSVSFNVMDGTAKQGVDFSVVGSNSLSFSPSASEQNIQIQIINHEGIFTGDVSFSIELGDPGAVHLGDSKRVTITILDLDHPLTPILGSYTATGQSYFDDPGDVQDWTITIRKDDNDLSKVWFHNLVPWVAGTLVDVYGIVDDDMTEIKIPVFQILSTGSGYALVRLEGSYGPDGYEYINDGGFITISIAPDKKSMVVLDEMYASVYADAGGSNYLGDFEELWAGTILVKD